MNERIGVIVPVYKTEKYVAECIESILAQTYTNLESWKRKEPERTRACQSVPAKAKDLLNLIKENPKTSRTKLSEKLQISIRQVRKIIDKLQETGVLTRESGDSGRWNINTDRNA